MAAKLRRNVLSVAVALVVMSAAPDATAYSVLAHEANIDAVWADSIRPLLARRFPRATQDDLRHARAYAYGGSVIQDLGYYPFGSRFFSNLLHYVRSGDFVQALIDESHDLDEYAFALGALAHYSADNAGHPIAVNRAVALMFPKLRAKYGDRITYADSPATHVLVEFSFDAVQVASGAYATRAYHDFIGFEVAKPVLERAFRRIYGLDVSEILLDEDLAISSYRHAVSQLIPEITRVAWRDKHNEIVKVMPNAAEQTFVFRFPRADYERDFGARYRKPSIFMRFLTVAYKVVPKIGPLRPLKFETPTREAEALFLDSFKQTRDSYRVALQAVRAGRLSVPNTDFDTGRRAAKGEYSLADETYAKLLDKLSKRDFATAPEALRRNIVSYYRPAAPPSAVGNNAKLDRKVRRQLAVLVGDVQ